MVHWEKRRPLFINHWFQQIVNVPTDIYHINLFQFFLIYMKIVKFVAIVCGPLGKETSYVY